MDDLTIMSLTGISMMLISSVGLLHIGYPSLAALSAISAGFMGLSMLLVLI